MYSVAAALYSVLIVVCHAAPSSDSNSGNNGFAITAVHHILLVDGAYCSCWSHSLVQRAQCAAQIQSTSA
jgi:hypothetical protein